MCILGTLLHFTFEWSGENNIVAVFSSINESTWEHLKLLFYPMLIMTVIGYFYFGSTVKNFLCAKLLGIIYAISFIIIFFYTYTGIIGTNFAVLDIGSFFVAAFIGEYVSFRKMFTLNMCNKYIAVTVLGMLLLAFIVFTYFPPKINFFKDPVTETSEHVSEVSVNLICFFSLF